MIFQSPFSFESRDKIKDDDDISDTKTSKILVHEEQRNDKPELQMSNNHIWLSRRGADEFEVGFDETDDRQSQYSSEFLEENMVNRTENIRNLKGSRKFTEAANFMEASDCDDAVQDRIKHTSKKYSGKKDSTIVMPLLSSVLTKISKVTDEKNNAKNKDHIFASNDFPEIEEDTTSSLPAFIRSAPTLLNLRSAQLEHG